MQNYIDRWVSESLAVEETAGSPYFLTLFLPFTEVEIFSKMKMKEVFVLLAFLMSISPISAMFKVTKYWSNVVSVGEEAKIACRLETFWHKKHFLPPLVEN